MLSRHLKQYQNVTALQIPKYSLSSCVCTLCNHSLGIKSNFHTDTKVLCEGVHLLYGALSLQGLEAYPRHGILFQTVLKVITI